MGVALDGEIPEAGTRLQADGKDVGFLTSVVDSPAMGRPLALGYLRTSHSEAGLQVEVRSDGRAGSGVILELPVA